jgi:hypothetical protein
VPVLVRDAGTVNHASHVGQQAESEAQTDPMDERIRRMIEAAYT